MKNTYTAQLFKTGEGSALIVDNQRIAVPNSGEFNNTISFNTSLTFDELVQLINSIPADQCTEAPAPVKLYFILCTMNNQTPENLIGLVLQPKENTPNEMELLISAQTTEGVTPIYDSKREGWLNNSIKITGTLVSEMPIDPNVPESLIPIGGANNQLIDLCFIQQSSEIKLDGRYNGTKFIADQNKVDLRLLIQQKKIPLDIETPISADLSALTQNYSVIKTFTFFPETSSAIKVPFVEGFTWYDFVHSKYNTVDFSLFNASHTLPGDYQLLHVLSKDGKHSIKADAIIEPDSEFEAMIL